MNDLILGMSINLIASSVIGLVIRQLSRQWPLRWVDVAGLLVVACLVLYLVYVWDQLWQLRWLPFSNMIVLGNGLPIFISALIGLACRRLKGRPKVRTLAVTMLACVGLGALARPLCGQTPICKDRWEEEVCLQSTPQTCSPAAAATVLRCFGVKTTEGEMASLCLTHTGTHWMGLYRGLRTKLPSNVSVTPLCSASLAELRQASRDQPTILIVSMPREFPTEWEYRAESGWLPGVSHSVVCFGPTANERWLIADPANGLETWSAEEMLILWHGDGFLISY